MKSVFARISTAIVAVAAVAASVLIVAPAASAAGTTNPAIYERNWTINKTIVTGLSANNTMTATLPVSANQFSAHVSFTVGSAQVAAHAGHTIRVTWNKTFPNGVSWDSTSGYNTASGLNKSYNAYVVGPSNVNDYTQWQFQDLSVAANKTADSNTFVIPASLSSITANEKMYVHTGIDANGSMNGWKAPAGTYTYAPTLTDVTTGELLPITNTDGNSDITVASNYWDLNGMGAYPGTTLPAGLQMRQSFLTCVEKSAIAAGDKIAVRQTVNGTETTGTAYLKKKGSYQNLQWVSQNGYTIQAADVDSTATGFRAEGLTLTDNSSGSSDVNVATYNYAIKKFASGTTDFSTGGTAVNSTCAPAQMPAPTFTLSGRSSATVAFDAAPSDSGSNSYTVKVFKASDMNTVFFEGSVYGSNNAGRYSTNLTFYNNDGTSKTVDNSTDYVAQISTYNRDDQAPSPYSVSSAPSQLVPPATPATPTALAVTVSRATATLAITYVAGVTYTASLYSSADNYTAPVGSGQCIGTSPTATTLACSVMPLGSTFSAPNSFKMGVVARTSSGLTSDRSPLSAAVLGGVPGVSLGAPSNGTGNGEAKTLTTTFPWITSNWGGPCMGMCSMPAATAFSDGLGKEYVLSQTLNNGTPVAGSYDLRRINTGTTGFDSAFGTGGKATTTITSSNPVSLPGVVLFANGTKIAYTNYVQACSQQGPCTQTNLLTEGPIGGPSSATVDIQQKLMDFCTANADSDLGTITNTSVSGFSGLQALSRPGVAIYCSSLAGNQRLIATLAADGTPTLLFKLHSFNSTQNYVTSYSVSAIPGATGTQTAAVALVVRAKRTYANNVTSYTNYERALVRIKANGAVVETTGAYTPTGNTEPYFRLASVNDGTTIYGINQMTMELVTIPVASGNVSAGTPIIMDSMNQMGGSDFSFPTTGVPNVSGEIALIRNDMGMSGTTFGPARLTISTGRLVTGEMLTQSSSGSPVSFSYIDSTGNLNYIYTPAVSPVPTTHTVVQWKNIRALVAQPNPTFISKDTPFSINAGGATQTITGGDLALTLAAKKVVSVSVGSKAISTLTKTATSIKFTIPSAAVAGVVGTPTPQAPSTVPVVINLGSGATISAGTLTYVGADKLVQTVTNTVSELAGVAGEADRNVPIQSSTLVQGAALLPTVAASPATVCTIVSGKVHFVTSGTCTVTATAAGNSWLQAATPVAKTITITKQTQSIAVTLSEALGLVGSADRDVTIVNTTTLNQQPVVTPTATPATVCSIVANKVRFLAPGICTVKVKSAEAPFFSASNEVTKTITVRKEEVITVDMNGVTTDDNSSGFPLPVNVASGRTYTPVSSNTAICRWDALNQVVVGVTTGNCTITISLPQDATWSAATTTIPLTITHDPGEGQTAARPKSIANTNSAIAYRYMSFTWNRTTGELKTSITSTYTGLNTATITWKDANNVTRTCTSAAFGINVKTTFASRTYNSLPICSTAAMKTMLANIPAGNVVDVKFVRNVKNATTNTVKTPVATYNAFTYHVYITLAQ